MEEKLLKRIEELVAENTRLKMRIEQYERFQTPKSPIVVASSPTAKPINWDNNSTGVFKTEKDLLLPQAWNWGYRHIATHEWYPELDGVWEQDKAIMGVE